jgi:hypothetical protein
MGYFGRHRVAPNQCLHLNRPIDAAGCLNEGSKATDLCMVAYKYLGWVHVQSQSYASTYVALRYSPTKSLKTYHFASSWVYSVSVSHRAHYPTRKPGSWVQS